MGLQLRPQLPELRLGQVALQGQQPLALLLPAREALEAEDDAQPQAREQRDLHALVEEDVGPAGVLVRHSGERIHAVPDRVHADDERDGEQRRPRDVAQKPAPRLREQHLPARRGAPLQQQPPRGHETRAALPQQRLPPAIARVAVILDRDDDHEQPEQTPEREQRAVDRAGAGHRPIVRARPLTPVGKCGERDDRPPCPDTERSPAPAEHEAEVERATHARSSPGTATRRRPKLGRRLAEKERAAPDLSADVPTPHPGAATTATGPTNGATARRKACLARAPKMRTSPTCPHCTQRARAAPIFLRRIRRRPKAGLRQSTSTATVERLPMHDDRCFGLHGSGGCNVDRIATSARRSPAMLLVADRARQLTLHLAQQRQALEQAFPAERVKTTRRARASSGSGSRARTPAASRSSTSCDAACFDTPRRSARSVMRVPSRSMCGSRLVCERRSRGRPCGARRARARARRAGARP